MTFWENIVYLSSCKFKMTIKLSMLVIDTSQSCLWENWVLLSGWPNYDLTSAYNFRSNSFSSTSITLFILQLSFVSPFLEFYDHPWSGFNLFNLSFCLNLSKSSNSKPDFWRLISSTTSVYVRRRFDFDWIKTEFKTRVSQMNGFPALARLTLIG